MDLEQCKFRQKKKKEIDLFDNELEDSSDESEIEAEWISWFVFFKMLKFSAFSCLFKNFIF